MCTLCKLTFILLENGRSQFSCHSRRFPCLSVQELFIRIASTLRYPHSFRRSLSLFRARRNASISHSFNPLCNLILHGDNLTPYSSPLPYFPLSSLVLLELHPRSRVRAAQPFPTPFSRRRPRISFPVLGSRFCVSAKSPLCRPLERPDPISSPAFYLRKSSSWPGLMKSPSVSEAL